jgi:protein SCO1/2
MPYASLVALLALTLLGALAPQASAHGPRHQVLSEETTATPRRGAYANPPAPETLGGAFELMAVDGSKITEKSYPRQWKLVFFGYPSCREACPTALDRLTLALEKLGTQAEKIRPMFVDISMERPDPKGVETFVRNFHPSIVSLTGSRAQVFHMVRLFQIRREYGRRNGPTETGPRIDHTTLFYLLDPDGRTRSYFHHGLTPDEMTESLRKFL